VRTEGILAVWLAAVLRCATSAAARSRFIFSAGFRVPMRPVMVPRVWGAPPGFMTTPPASFLRQTVLLTPDAQPLRASSRTTCVPVVPLLTVAVTPRPVSG
jgi:hypothetical protein